MTQVQVLGSPPAAFPGPLSRAARIQASTLARDAGLVVAVDCCTTTLGSLTYWVFVCFVVVVKQSLR